MNTAKSGRTLASGLLASLSMAAALTSFQAQAVVLALDDFSYSVGELEGANGGSGFSGAWSTQNTAVNDGLPYTGVTAPGMSYFDPISNITLPDVGNAGEYRAFGGSSTLNLQNRGRRDLSAPANQETLFMSVLMRQTSGDLGNLDSAFVWFGSTGQSANTIARLGFFGQTTGDEFGAQLSNGSTFTTSRAGGQVSLGGSGTLFVAKLTKIGATGATDPFDKLDLWINPVLEATTFTGAPTLSITLASTISSFSRIGFGNTSLDANPLDIVEFDRLRLGTEIGDVVRLPDPTPVPEASTYLGAGFAMLLGGGVYLRRRNRAAAAA